MRSHLELAVALASLAAVTGCDPSIGGNSLGLQCDLSTQCEAPLVCRMSRCRRECATIRDCPIGARCVLDERGLGSCLLEDEARCEATEDCPGPLVCDEAECVNECDADRPCPPGARCNDDGRCGDVQGHICQFDSECVDGFRCGPDGRCREECLEDRDCPDESRCVAGGCQPIDAGAGAGMDAGVHVGRDGAAPDAELDATSPDGGPTDAGPVFCPDGSACDPAPSATVGCVMGQCGVLSCDAPFLDCDGDVRNGCEANPETNRWHCGGCGVACGAGEACLAGACVTASVRDIAAGARHSCALWSTGQVTCWGGNDRGQLGDGTGFVDRPVPVMVTGVTDAEALVAGSLHNCVLRTGGAVSCWGDDGQGQLGDGGAITAGDTTHTPVEAMGITAAIGVTAGTSHNCIWRSDGTAACWGDNWQGQLGNGTTTDSSSPAPLSTLTDVTSVSAGDRHSCALTSGSGPHCWGSSGRIGDGTLSQRLTPWPVSMPAGETFTDVVAGGPVTLALTADGRVYCWGFNANHECGMSSTADRFTTPEENLLLSSVSAVTDRCALLDDGTVRCWGRNAWGQAGTGTTEEPLDVPETLPTPAVSSIATYSAHTCVLLSSGSIRCVGADGQGRLGDGIPSEYELTFRPVVGLP